MPSRVGNKKALERFGAETRVLAQKGTVLQGHFAVLVRQALFFSLYYVITKTAIGSLVGHVEHSSQLVT